MDLSKVFIGQLVIVRTEHAGVFVGTLVGRDGQTALLEQALRVHYWKGARTLSEMANHGVSAGSRLSERVNSQLVFGVKEILPVSDAARQELGPQWA
jgi:hypothetical protein